MNRNFLVLPLAALALSACGRDGDRTPGSNPQLPSTAQQPPNVNRPAAGTQMNPDTSDPSIPSKPVASDPTKKDRSPPDGTGDPIVRKPGGK